MRSKDGLVREAIVAYRNHTENFNRLTNRAVRSLVKLFSIDEDCVQEDLAKLQKRIDRLNSGGHVQQVGGQQDWEQQQVDVQHDAQTADAKFPSIYEVIFSTTEDNEEDTNSGEPGLVLLSHEHVSFLGIQRGAKCCDKCCCLSHCRVSNHHTLVWKKAKEFTNPFMVSSMVNVDDENMEDFNISVEKNEARFYDERKMGDGLTNLLMNVNIDFSGKF